MAEPGDIAAWRREARSAVAAPPGRELGEEYASTQAVGFLAWGDGRWRRSFDSLARARAFFDEARRIGIDYDYAAYFDVSTPRAPRLVWEELGPPTVAGARIAEHSQSSLRTQGEPMTPLIGKKGGAGMGGHGHGHGRGRRQFFGGGWGGYPYYYDWWPYGYPAYPAYMPGYSYEETDETISGRRGGMGRMGMGMGRRRRHRSPDQSFGEQDGGGGLMPYVPQNGNPDEEEMMVSGDNELFALLPVLAPGAGGIGCRMDLGPDLQLHVEICVDGQCYQGGIDLSGVLAHIADGAAVHHGQGAGMPPGSSAVDAQASQAVQTAGLALVGALYDQHVNTVSAGWLDGLKKVATFAVSPLLFFHKEIGQTLKQFKEPIALAAGIAATAYGGPAGGAAAAQLTGPLLDALAGDSGDAQKLAQGIQQQAAGDPVVQKALGDATKAVANTAAAYHVTKVAANAAAGDASSAAKIAELEAAASRGDVAAIQAMQIISGAFAQAEQNRAKASPDAVSSAGEKRRQSRADQNVLREEGSAAARAFLQQGAGPVIGYVKERGGQRVQKGGGVAITMNDSSGVFSFESVNDADDWFGSLDPRVYRYAAYYDASDPTWPSPVHEMFGRSKPALSHDEMRQFLEDPSDHPATHTSGIWPWLALGAAGGGAWAWWRRRQARREAEIAAAAPPPGGAAAPTTTGAWWPLLALGAGGAAGWYGREWWLGRQMQKAAEAAAAAALPPPHVDVLAPPPGAAPALAPPTAASGWW